MHMVPGTLHVAPVPSSPGPLHSGWQVPACVEPTPGMHKELIGQPLSAEHGEPQAPFSAAGSRLHGALAPQPPSLRHGAPPVAQVPLKRKKKLHTL